MYDAAGIRRHAGYQAQILNRLMSDLPPDHPMSDQDMLKEVLGHSRTEVSFLKSNKVYFELGIWRCIVGTYDWTVLAELTQVFVFKIMQYWARH